MKKLIALLVVSMLIIGVLAACSNDTPEATPAPTPAPSGTTVTPPEGDDKSEGQLLAEELGLPYTPLSEAAPITFTYFDRSPRTAPGANNPIINAIEVITNTKIEWEFLVGELEQKIGVMLASGDWPDMAFFGGEAGPFLDSGLVLPLQDLITDYAPNLRSHYDPWWNLMFYGRPDLYVAEIFGTPVGTQYVNEHWGTAFWLQKAVLEHFERAPANLDEYFDFIRGYMEAYPTIDGVPTIGFEILTDGWRRFCIDNPPMFMAGYGNWGPAAVDQFNFDDVTGVSTRWRNDWNKAYYKKLNDEYHLGTISRETLTRSFDDYLATLASGAVLGMSDQLWNFNSGLDPLRAEGRWERTYLPLDFTNPGVTPNYLDAREFTGNNGIIVNRNISDPVRLIQYWDYLIQEDVQRFLSWGIEGEHWFYNDAGRIERPQDQRELQRETRWKDDNMGEFLYNAMPKMQGSFADGNATVPGEQPEEYLAGLTEYDQELFGKLGIKNQTGLMSGGVATVWPVYYPFWSMSYEAGSPAELADQRITDVNTRYLSALVVAPADGFDALWDEYQTALEGTGEQDLLDEIVRQAKERLAAFGG